MSIEFVERNINQTITVFDVWNEILAKHPEIVKLTAKSYANHPHGQTVDQEVCILPIERVLGCNKEEDFYGNDQAIKAIGAKVEVRPDNFDPEIDYSNGMRWYDGDRLWISKDGEKSFIFVDFESNPTPETTNMIVNTMSRWNSDWYLLDSGASYHLILPILIDLNQLPIYYGGLIMDFSRNLSQPRNKFYSAMGAYLIKNHWDHNKIKDWNEEVKRLVGHVENAHETGKYVFPIDLRYMAHVLDSFINNNENEGYLRVSSKHGSVPVLVAKKVGHFILNYKYQENIFDRKQIPLPEI